MYALGEASRRPPLFFLSVDAEEFAEFGDVFDVHLVLFAQGGDELVFFGESVFVDLGYGVVGVFEACVHGAVAVEEPFDGGQWVEFAEGA